MCMRGSAFLPIEYTNEMGVRKVSKKIEKYFLKVLAKWWIMSYNISCCDVTSMRS